MGAVEVETRVLVERMCGARGDRARLRLEQRR